MSVRRAILLVLLAGTYAHAQGPQPPCGNEPVPAYSRLNDAPAVKLWSKAEFGRDWKPPACTGWTATGFSTLVTIAARFHQPAGLAGLLHHGGAISELAGMHYWSTTHKQWQVLILEAHALKGAQAGEPRADFATGEMKAGAILYFEQTDNLAGKAVYRLHLAEVSEDRVVFDVENVTPLRYFLITLFHPGEMQSIYFLNRESEDVWRYYGMVRTGRNASGLTAGNEASSINRAVAFYRQLAGIPTDQEPPAAR
jgi:hypothetical protein